MKKKTIEKFPWQLEGKKTNRKKQYYINAYELDDQMLIIDCYDIRFGEYIRAWRLALSDTGYITLMADGSWSNALVSYTIGIEQYGIYGSYAKKEFDKYYIPKESEELIMGWLDERERFLNHAHVFKGVYDYQYHMRNIKRETAAERHYDKLQRKAAELPDLPSGFKRFLRDKVYKDKHIMYLTEETGFCSRCGRTMQLAQKHKHNESGSCPACKKRVVFKSIKRIKEHEDTAEILIIQEHKDEIVYRYVRTCLYQDGEHKERISFNESVRTYHDEFLTYRSKLIHWHDGMIGSDYWTDKNSYYKTVVYGKNTMLYTGNREELQTILNPQWLDMMTYWTDNGIKMPLIEFMQMSENRAEIAEKLHKCGLHKLTKEFVKGNVYSLRWQEKEPKKILRLSKPLFNWAQQNDITLSQYVTLADAYEGNYGLSDAEIIELASSKIGIGVLKDVTKNRKYMKTFHYLQRAAGYKDINERMRHYRDYLNMAMSMHYDLDNDTVRYPKDVKAAHDKATSEFNEIEADKKKQEALKKYPMIGQVSDALLKIYGFHDKTYEIITPVNASDIIEEGRVLHHCVGGDGYLNKHNTGQSFILFMRKVEEPESRYYTIEIDSKSQEIKQYYGAYDKKPDKEAVDKFLSKWKRHIKEELKNGIINLSELYAV